MARWFKLDCGSLTHPKVIDLDDNEFRFWIQCIAYAAEHGTDGVIKRSWVMRVAQRPIEIAHRLIEIGLMDENGEDFMLHDYLQYQPHSSHWKNLREAGRKGAEVRWAKAKAMASPNGTNTNTNTNTNTKEKKEKEKAKEIVAAPLALIETPARDDAVILRELASNILLARNDFLPPDLEGDKGKRWESAVRNLMVKDGVPFERIEFVTRNVWDQEFHANRFLKHTTVRSTFTSVLNAVNAKHKPKDFAIKNMGDAKASALLAASERMKQQEEEVWS